MEVDGPLHIRAAQIKSEYMTEQNSHSHSNNNTNSIHNSNQNTNTHSGAATPSSLLSPARPVPAFVLEGATFSTKKERDTPKLIDIHPPKPPIKSCPPISRIRPMRKPEYEGVRVISFLNKNPNDCDLFISQNKHYDDSKNDLFFEQCFIIEGNLGCGSFGKVYKVKSKDDGKYYAIKKSREKFKGHSDRTRKLEEVAKHEELPPHPNFVKFYRAWEEKQRLYIQTELCLMSLSAYAEKHHNIPEDTIWQFLIDCLQALKELHSRKLVHMDIKPENIFISFDGYCKLGDFGLVIDLNKSDLIEVQEGDPKYLAPEVLVSYNNITCAADVFSLGMTILELATDLDLPRGGDAWHQLRNGQIPAHLISSLSSDLIQVIMKMIEPDHVKRATVNELLETYKIRSMIEKYAERTSILIDHNYGSYYKKRNLSHTSNEDENHDQHLRDHNKTQSSESEQNTNTSTPKKDESFSNMAHLSMLHADNDDHRDMHYDSSFNEKNNSYINNPLEEDLLSTESDNSDFSLSNRYAMSSARKTKTEPPLNKIFKLNQLKFEASPKSISPSKTPPWKPLNNSNARETTPLAFTRQRLNFDDSFDEIETYEKQHSEQMKLSQNHGEFSTPMTHCNSNEKQTCKHKLSNDLNSTPSPPIGQLSDSRAETKESLLSPNL